MRDRLKVISGGTAAGKKKKVKKTMVVKFSNGDEMKVEVEEDDSETAINMLINDIDSTVCYDEIEGLGYEDVVRIEIY